MEDEDKEIIEANRRAYDNIDKREESIEKKRRRYTRSDFEPRHSTSNGVQFLQVCCARASPAASESHECWANPSAMHLP